ncbi:MAG: hypothetical protein II825_09700 [Paludibacteraceae bacterium]|nr:hypothetical protein [Paludibacteraceae bacterium]
MRKENNTPHMGMIVALGVLIAAIWMLAIYDTIQDAHEERYDVSVRPGAVSYGTHSSATIPMVSSPMHSTSAPMISGSAVRSYAHYGHASMPSSAVGSGFKMHTTSSATVHTVGSGGGSSGGGSSASGGQGTSSRGITYGGASVSMPTFALVTPMYSSSATMEAPARFGVGPRRAKPTEEGEEGDAVWDPDEGRWWTWDPNMGDYGDWRYVTDGDTRYNSGEIEYWNGSKWVSFEEWSNPGVPLGDAPWLWILLLALAYGIAKMVQRKRNAIQ